jgi:Mycothiol maleylpyruvate isomerase N-terminal domain
VDIAEQYLSAAEAACLVLEDPHVAEAWERPSTLPLYTVAGLAGHLAGQVGVVLKVLHAPPLPRAAATLSGPDFLRQQKWIDAPDDDEVHRGIRRSADTYAERGAPALAVRTRASLEQIQALLADEDVQRPVQFPWGSHALSLEDLLANRLMELIVHIDDLVVSVGAPSPEVPDAVAETALHLLIHVAARRNGWQQQVRALTRTDRLTGTATAF